MIVSENKNPPLSAFERVLSKAHHMLENEAKNNNSYFLKRNANEFEEDVYHSLVLSSKNTEFESTIELISGYRFPDIIAKKLYGVEVKTTKQNHWKSTGNSVLETTRVEFVENIFIYFGKLANPVGFKYKPYQDCLYDIAVTHSPRYLIDMDINTEDTIFSKLQIPYNKLRQLPNPIKPFVDFYRKKTRPGEEPWWMDENKALVNPTIRIFSNLLKEEKEKFVTFSIAYFPEIFGKSPTKYHRIAGWLASRYGVVDSSLRDRFSAGGQVTLELGLMRYDKIPRIYMNLSECFREIINIINETPLDDLSYYWGKELNSYTNLIDTWLKLVFFYSEEASSELNRFLIHLFADKLGDINSDFVNEKFDDYGLR